MRRHKLLMVPLTLGVLAFVFLSATYISIAWGFTPPDQIIGAKGVQIYDRDGQLLFDFGDEPGSSKVLPLGELPPALINATLATEDADFWDNPGVNLKGLLRATYENLAFWNGGFFHGSGGSSISQQLAKNLYIKPEERTKRSPMRKIKETLVAFELTRRYSKQEILQWYLSNIYYGNGAYGIGSASERYFSKAPSELTLAEAALLAGIPRGPTLYDPIANFDVAVERQREVLSLMLRHHFIDQSTYEAALTEPVALDEGRDPSNQAVASNLAPHFAIYVRDLLPAILGKDNVEGNLKVTTTIDSRLQQAAETILTTNLDKFETQVGASNGALVSIDPTTGEVLAMVGSHDFFRDDISGQVNNATALNQPGSTMKPITYLAAMIKGWSPSTIIVDEPMTIPNGDSSYVLNNADLRYRGAVPVRVALGSSLNVPAVKTLQYVGLQQVRDLAQRWGLTSLRELGNYGPAFTLGAADASLLDMVYVYSMFANQGQQAGMSSVLGLPGDSRTLDPIAVLQIETPDGKVLWKAKHKQDRLAPANTVYLLTNILSDDSARASMFGTGSPLVLAGRPAAVKSGLSDDARDAWAIGYTPQLVTGVWVGNANNKPMTGATSTFTAAPIWNAFMREALKDKPVVNFAVPEGITFVDVCSSTGLPPTAGCSNVVREPFLSNRLPAGASAVKTPTVSPTPGKETPTPRQSQTASPTPPTSTPRATLTVTPVLPTKTPSMNTPTATPKKDKPTPTSTQTSTPQASPTPPAGTPKP